MDAFAAASAKHQPKSYIPSIVKTQNILILLLFFGADWSVRAVKFMFSKKATKIDEIFTVDLT